MRNLKLPSRSTALAVRLAFGLMLVLFLPAPAPAATLAADHDATFAQDWMRLVVERVKAEGYSPLVASRIYAYAGVTLYESALPGMPDHQTLAGQLHELTALPQPGGGTLDWPAVTSAALAGLVRDLFPNPSAASALSPRSRALASASSGSVASSPAPPEQCR